MSAPPLVVLAAGLSTRYGRLKQLDPLGPGGESIMDYNVYDAARAGFGRAVFVIRPEIRDALRSHVEGVVGDAMRVEFVDQTVEVTVDGFTTPLDRGRPWGTGHAVLCARDVLDGPFAVCNSDDLYGPGAFRLLYDYFAEAPPTPDAALVGYTLIDTLSLAGGVSRAVCTLRGEGLLARITEIQDVRRTDRWITGREVDGAPVELEAHAMVSMNIWGFTPHVLDLLGRQFVRFFEYWGADPVAEFFLSTALNGQVQIGATRVAVLDAPDTWFGVTHSGERELAQETLAARIAAGVYPERLAEAFSALD